MASRCEDGTVTGDFLDELPNFHIVTFEKFIKREEDANTQKKKLSFMLEFHQYLYNK